MAAAIINRFGFSRSEAATFWDVREDTVKKWESGKMEMPTTLELTALEQIKDWQSYCERMAAAYNELFKDEPETFIGVPTPAEAVEYGVPDSQGFIANTVAAICAELAYDNHQLVLLTSDDATEKNFFQEAREAAFMWMFNFAELAELRASLSEVELAVTDFAVTRLRKDLKDPITAILSTTEKLTESGRYASPERTMRLSKMPMGKPAARTMSILRSVSRPTSLKNPLTSNMMMKPVCA